MQRHEGTIRPEAYYAPQDILPKEGGLKAKNYGQCAIRSDGVL